MAERLSGLYAIADRGALEARGLGLAEFVGELLEAGVRVLQYRDKWGSPQEVLRAAAILSEIVGGRECLPVMNDRADLAVLAGWRAVHVGQGDLPVEAVRRVFGSLPCRIGVSTHTEEQVRAAEGSVAHYVAVGPVFATGSKSDAEPVIGLEGVRRARALTSKPLVAIGGITLANARSVVDAGADSVAVIGALLATGERPGKVARAFLDLLLE